MSDTNYTGEHYLFAGTWDDGTTTYVVSASAVLSGHFLDDQGGSIYVSRDSDTSLALERTVAAVVLPI